MRIVPFQAGHITLLEPRGPDIGLLQSFGDPLAVANSFAANGLGMTVLVDGRPIACAGIVFLWKGVGEAWTLTSPLVEQHRKSFHRAVVTMLDQTQTHRRLHRVQTAVHEGFEVSQFWLERLGFACEGAMVDYGPDRETYLRYARVC